MTRWTCASVKRRLARYHDGELAIDQRRVVDTHLATCAACAADLLEYEELGEVLRATAHAAPVPDREAFRAAVMARFHAEQDNSWAATFEEWRHDVGLRWAGLSAVGATMACALILFGIAWMVPLDHEGGFTRMPTPKAQDVNLTSYRAEWPQRSINNDVIPAVLSSTRDEDRVVALAEEDVVLALAALVTQEGRRTGAESFLANRDDREVVLRLMNAVQHARFTPVRDPNTGAPAARYVVWLLAHTTVRGRFDRS